MNCSLLIYLLCSLFIGALSASDSRKGDKSDKDIPSSKNNLEIQKFVPTPPLYTFLLNFLKTRVSEFNVNKYANAYYGKHNPPALTNSSRPVLTNEACYTLVVNIPELYLQILQSENENLEATLIKDLTKFEEKTPHDNLKKEIDRYLSTGGFTITALPDKGSDKKKPSSPVITESLSDSDDEEENKNKKKTKSTPINKGKGPSDDIDSSDDSNSQKKNTKRNGNNNEGKPKNIKKNGDGEESAEEPSTKSSPDNGKNSKEKDSKGKDSNGNSGRNNNGKYVRFLGSDIPLSLFIIGCVFAAVFFFSIIVLLVRRRHQASTVVVVA
jgi:hypothetical protein